jgi:hypothetical protein
MELKKKIIPFAEMDVASMEDVQLMLHVLEIAACHVPT